MNDSLLVTLTIGDLTNIIGNLFTQKLKENLPPPPTRYFNGLEACDFLRCSHPTLRGYVKNGRIQKHKLGSKNLFLESDLQKLAITLKSFKQCKA
ncbi:MAG: hypothetical protein CFE25_17140 [Chitinophagaceae bacterium BSSC1]|nr:MAG: hypothetical protein CFE25_17140 [Chitinophagaceae bacterium BSSC1]